MVQNACVVVKVIWIIIVSSANCISGLASDGGQSSSTSLGPFRAEDELSNCPFYNKTYSRKMKKIRRKDKIKLFAFDKRTVLVKESLYF